MRAAASGFSMRRPDATTFLAGIRVLDTRWLGSAAATTRQGRQMHNDPETEAEAKRIMDGVAESIAKMFGSPDDIAAGGLVSGVGTFASGGPIAAISRDARPIMPLPSPRPLVGEKRDPGNAISVTVTNRLP